MRKFKILKDTPLDKAGDIFVQHQYSIQKETDKYHYISNKNIIYGKQRVENNPEWFEEIIEPKFQTDFSKLKNLKGYYAVDNNISYYDVEKNHGSNLNHHDLFSTRSLAKSCLALAQLSQFAKEWNSLVPRNEYVWYIKIDRDGLCIDFTLPTTIKAYSLSFIEFNSQELAELSLQHHKDLWLDYYQRNNEEN